MLNILVALNLTLGLNFKVTGQNDYISQLEFTAKASDMEIKEIPTEYSVLMSSSLNWLILLMPVSYRTTGPMFF